MASDLRYALRALARRPLLAIVTSGALTIGIAANAIMFGVVDQLMLEPPPLIEDPQSVRRVFIREHLNGEPTGSSTTAYRLLASLRAVPAFSGVATYNLTSVTLGRGADAERLTAMAVSQNYFRLLRVRPALGRDFLPEEDTPPQGPLVAIIGDGFWHRALGGARDVVGHTLTLDGKTFTIVGVAPAGFAGVDRYQVDLWVPMSAVTADQIGPDWATTTNSLWVHGIARVAPNANVTLAEGQATTVYRSEIKSWQGVRRDSTGTIALGSLATGTTENGFAPEAKVAVWLLGVSAIVLLIACANVANILIARTIERRREIAVRLALGASRGQLLRQLLVEAALLSAIATIAALVVARIGSSLVQRLLLPGFAWGSSVIDAPVLGFTLLVAVLCVLLAGLAPAIQAARSSVNEGLKSSNRQIAGGSGRARAILLGVQVSLSVILLVGAGLFVRSLRHVVEHDVGIDLDRVALVTLDIGQMKLSGAEIRDLYREARDRAAAVPGVERAALVGGTVPGRETTAFNATVPGRKSIALPGGDLWPYMVIAGRDYLATIGTHLVRGRLFTPEEEAAPSRVMLVNRVVANAYWPGADPIGQCVMLGEEKSCTTVVGVVENVMLFKLVGDDRGMWYLPPSHETDGFRPSALAVRSSGDVERLVALLHRVLRGLRSNTVYVDIAPYTEIVAPQMRSWRLGATMFSMFGTLATLIAAVGLYSVMAYWASQRTHEIGVRMALGAETHDVVRLIGVQAGRTVLLGLCAGAVLAAVLSRWVADLLYDTSPYEVSVYILAALTLGIAAIVAMIVPARRVATVDPAVALRAE
ncbi:MAG TPA: ADOP family duplicated permease [Gemmatimonadaceae bacterium]